MAASSDAEERKIENGARDWYCKVCFLGHIDLIRILYSFVLYFEIKTELIRSDAKTRFTISYGESNIKILIFLSWIFYILHVIHFRWIRIKDRNLWSQSLDWQYSDRNSSHSHTRWLLNSYKNRIDQYRDSSIMLLHSPKFFTLN